MHNLTVQYEQHMQYLQLDMILKAENLVNVDMYIKIKLNQYIFESNSNPIQIYNVANNVNNMIFQKYYDDSHPSTHKQYIKASKHIKQSKQ